MHLGYCGKDGLGDQSDRPVCVRMCTCVYLDVCLHVHACDGFRQF